MAELALLLSGLVVFIYALVSKRLAQGIVTGPIIFLALGLMLDRAGLVDLHDAEVALHVLAELTLVIVLFADAAAINVTALRQRLVWPERMLIAGLPLAVLFGFLIGALLLPSWPFWEVALLAAILAPTDAALGQAMVTNKAVPEPVREALTVESGVNDGLALPAVLMFACLAVEGAHDNVQINWAVFAMYQIGLGSIAGLAVGYLGAKLLALAADRGYSAGAFEGIAVLALAGLSYLAAVAIGGNGFLAAFVGGLSFGTVMKGRCAFVFEFMETEGQLLVLGTFLLLGAAAAPHALAHVEPVWLVLILLSLFVVRPAAIWLSLWRSDASPLAKGFMGWFGPRGLATALFALLVVGDFVLLTKGDEILSIAVLAVLISAVLHGVSAAPGARWFAGRINQQAIPAMATKEPSQDEQDLRRQAERP